MTILTQALAQKLIDEQGTGVVIPDTYTSISDKAFYIKQLTSIEIPDSITSIGNKAFYGNYDLKSIKIGNSVESIGDYAFGNTDNEGTGSEYISIPDSVKTIGDGAFYALYNLERIEIGSGLTSIPDFAFAHSSGLKKVTIPSGIESIGHAAFHNTSLKKVVIPKSVKTISTHAFNPSVNIIYDSQGEAPTELTISGSSFNENITAGSAVATISSTDQDDTDTFTYSLVSGNGNTDNSAFTIDGDQLKINASPDYETQDSYSVRLKTTDSGGLSFERAFTLTVNDLSEYLDSDSDGFVDGSSNYKLFVDSGTPIDLTNKSGRKYSDASTKSWDAIKSIKTDSGFQVLLDGAAKYENKFYVWTTNSSGVITKGSGWKTGDQMMQLGYEDTFNMDINKDTITGTPLDSDSDGFVDGSSNYKLFVDSGTPIDLTNKSGRKYSDASTKSWDAIKSIKTDSGFQVLLDGAASKENQFYVWTTNSSGVITKGSGWKTGDQMMQLGYEDTFNMDINGDKVTGLPLVDSDSDGFVDGSSNYKLFVDSGTPIDLTNKSGRKYSDASTTSWDAVKSIKTDSGFQVLLDGAAKYENKFYVWTTNSSGVITKGSGWKTGGQALAAGWEIDFDADLNGDNRTGGVSFSVNTDGFDFSYDLLEIKFSEPVSGFTPSDIQITVDNGRAARGGSYTFSIDSDGNYKYGGNPYEIFQQWINVDGPMDGYIKIQIAEGAATAADGTPTNAFSYTSNYIDTVKPTYNLQRSSYRSFSNEDRIYTFEFDEEVKGFSSDAFSGDNFVGPKKTNLGIDFQVIEEGLKYQATVKAPVTEYRGNLGMTVDFSSVTDLAGNSVQMPSDQLVNKQWDVNMRGSKITYLSTYDTDPPAPILSWNYRYKDSILSDTNKFAYFNMNNSKVEYHDTSVNGLSQSDWIIEGGYLSSPDKYGGYAYANDDEEGILSIYLPEGSYTDNSGNPNKRSNTISMAYDRKNPEVVSTSKTFDPITGLASYSLNFSEAVTDLSKDTISVYDAASRPGQYIRDRKITSEYSSTLDGETKTVHYKPLSVVDNSQIDKVNVSGSFWNAPSITDLAGNSLSRGNLYETFNPLEP